MQLKFCSVQKKLSRCTRKIENCVKLASIQNKWHLLFLNNGENNDIKFFKLYFEITFPLLSYYNLTLKYPTSLLNTTVSFTERVNGWTSFKSFIPEGALSLNNKYYSFKTGELFVHDNVVA